MKLINIADGSVVNKSDLYREIGKGLAIGAGTSMLWYGLTKLLTDLIQRDYDRDVIETNQKIMDFNRSFLDKE